MSKFVKLRQRHFSFLIAKKTIWVSLLLLSVTIIVAIVSSGLGSLTIHPWQVVLSIFGQGDPMEQVVVRTIRLPRTVMALLVGSALAVSGVILQGMIRNPLASPEIVGITGGASLAAVIFLCLSAGTLSIHWLPVSAIIGAAGTTLMIYLFAWKQGVTAMRLVLIGIGISAGISALTSFILLVSPTQVAVQAMNWLTGSIYGASWKQVVTLLPWLILFIPLSLAFARHLNVQELGDDIAAGVGSRVQIHRFALLCISIFLAGSAVAFAGAIGFIGLMAPHMARKLVGPSFESALPVSALLGALLLLAADLIARTAFSPLDVPAGVFTTAIGAPFFIYLLYRSGKNR